MIETAYFMKRDSALRMTPFEDYKERKEPGIGPFPY